MRSPQPPDFLIVLLVCRGYCDLMDDLLRRMEQYASNLEVLVSEKTEELSQEKRRSEELLYQVLVLPSTADWVFNKVLCTGFATSSGSTIDGGRNGTTRAVWVCNDLFQRYRRVYWIVRQQHSHAGCGLSQRFIQHFWQNYRILWRLQGCQPKNFNSLF